MPSCRTRPVSISTIQIWRRHFQSLPINYLAAASLAVSLTFTPVLASFLLPSAKFLDDEQDPFLLRGLKWVVGHILRLTLRHAYVVLGVVAGVLRPTKGRVSV